MSRILLKTTQIHAHDDWHIRRFSLLHLQLSALMDTQGNALFEVLAHDRRDDAAGNDQDLQSLFEQGIEQLWLFGVDSGGGLSPADLDAIEYFRQRGGACLFARGAQETGICLSDLDIIGQSLHDTHTHYNAGQDGDCQTVFCSQRRPHPIMQNAQGRALQYLPAHHGENHLEIPLGCEDFTQIIARGTCQDTQQNFNLSLAFDAVADAFGSHLGRAVVDASFQHFSDYNLDPSFGAPSFLSHPAGHTMLTHPQARADSNTYFSNIALWLAGEI